MHIAHSQPRPEHAQDLIPNLAGGDAFEVISGPAKAGVLILADHASNHIPAEFNNLGMAPEQLERHIAYDIGVAWMTEALAKALDAPAVLSRFSRLLIDPNRGDDDPTLVMRLSDGALVPGNARIDAKGIHQRMQRFSLPYHGAVSDTLDTMIATGIIPAVVSLHSYTPCMKGRPRPWQVGILWDNDPRMPKPFIEALRRDDTLLVGDNEPYDGALTGDTMARHCISRGLPHILIEVRQDLIASRDNATAWGARLAEPLLPLLQDPDLHKIAFFETRAR